MPVEKKRVMVSVKILPKANEKWDKLAKDIGLSKGKILEKFLGFDPVPGLDEIESAG